MHNEPRVCVDKTLETRRLEEAAEEARRERAGNAPDGSLLGDAISALFRSDVEVGAAVLLTDKKWQPGREIKVGWFRDEWTEDDVIREKVRYHVSRLEVYANLDFRFIGFSPEEADIRISMERGRSASYVGTDNLLISRDEPTMWLGWLDRGEPDEEYRRVVKHEFLHAAGLGHEHQNPKGGLPWNEEAVYAYYTRSQGWSREDVYYQVIRRYSVDMVTATQRDPKSIMHYPVPAELLTDPSKAVGFNTDLSAGDKAFLRSIYPYPNQEAA